MDGSADSRKKRVAFRFDIDTLACMREGVPNLLHLARRYGVSFSFYVNLGRSVSWRALWRKRRRASGNSAKASAKLSPYRKLGLRDYATTVLMNPPVGSSYPKTLEEIVRGGHELGLHGGMDHGLWQHGLETLSVEQLADLFRPAYREFHDRFGQPVGFASPGFVHNSSTYELLEQYGFRYVSDVCADTPIELARVDAAEYPFWQVPVNVFGPAKVPILEAAVAEGVADSEAVARTLGRVEEVPWAVIYAHPCFEGKAGLGLFERVLAACSSDCDVMTVCELLERTTGEKERGGAPPLG